MARPIDPLLLHTLASRLDPSPPSPRLIHILETVDRQLIKSPNSWVITSLDLDLSMLEIDIIMVVVFERLDVSVRLPLLDTFEKIMIMD